MSSRTGLKSWRLGNEVDVASESFVVRNGDRVGSDDNWCDDWNFGLY